MWAIHREGGRSAFGDKSVCVCVYTGSSACVPADAVTGAHDPGRGEGVEGWEDG